MLYKILFPLRDIFFGFNVFKYISFRAILAFVSSFFIFCLFYPRFIRYLKKIGMTEKVLRESCEKLYPYHSHKEGIPTSGGLLIIFSTVVATLFFSDFLNPYVLLAMFSTVLLGMVGYWDDFLKLKLGKQGLRKRYKLLAQAISGLILAGYLYLKPDYLPTLEVPFFKSWVINLGLFYFMFVILVVAGTSNAVNLTDGLDGLAIGAGIIAASAFAVMAYLAGNIKFSSYLFISYIAGAGELTVFLSALVGASVGFLWYNAYPAEVFMGDSGSLALGGAIASVAVIIKKELLLLIIGGLFVIETVSVLIQVLSYRTRRKRVFYFTPIHHHFQIKGWPEPKIIVRFWILSILFALLSLLTLKIR